MATAVPPSAQGGGGSSSIPPDANSLLHYAKQIAQKKGFFLAEDFKKAFLREVEPRLQDFGYHDEQEAYKNTKELIGGSIRIATNRGGTILDGDIFQELLTLRDFCPLWPFCD